MNINFKAIPGTKEHGFYLGSTCYGVICGYEQDADGYYPEYDEAPCDAYRTLDGTMIYIDPIDNSIVPERDVVITSMYTRQPAKRGRRSNSKNKRRWREANWSIDDLPF